MRTICKDVYKYDELSAGAKSRARDWYREASASDNYVLDEMMDSLKALFKAANIKIKDWSVGAYNRNNYVSFDMGDAGELTGARALAWLENNLLDGLRITRAEFMAKRRDYLKYGDSYRVGKIKPCPFTGVCYDDDLLDSLRADVKSGDTLKDAFSNLADKVGRMNEDALEYQNKDEQVAEMIEANEYEFTEDGNRI